MDPHARNYVSISSYSYVNNNPIGSIDPDGRDLIVLSAPDHVHGLGHAAVLIGNDKTGWDLYSKNGTTSSSGATGPANKDPNIGSGTGQHYRTLDEFNMSDENLQGGVTQYKEGYRLKTDEKTDEKMRKKAQEAVLSTYIVLGQSCIDVASDALVAGSFNSGESNNHSMDSPLGWLIPYKRYDRIKKQNPNGTVVNFVNYFPSGIKKIIPEGTVTSSGGHVGPPTPND